MRYENVLQALMKVRVAVGNTRNTLQYRHKRHDLPNVMTVDVSHEPLCSLSKTFVQFNRIKVLLAFWSVDHILYEHDLMSFAFT